MSWTYILLLLVLLLTTGVYYLLTSRSKTARIWLVCLLTLILTACSMFFLNAPDTLSTAEDKLVERLVATHTADGQAAKTFLRNNFILINNAYAKELLPAPGPD